MSTESLGATSRRLQNIMINHLSNHLFSICQLVWQHQKHSAVATSSPTPTPTRGSCAWRRVHARPPFQPDDNRCGHTTVAANRSFVRSDDDIREYYYRRPYKSFPIDSPARLVNRNCTTIVLPSRRVFALDCREERAPGPKILHRTAIIGSAPESVPRVLRNCSPPNTRPVRQA